MPIYLRLYYLKRLKEQYKDENEAIEKASKKNRANIPKPKKPNELVCLLNCTTNRSPLYGVVMVVNYNHFHSILLFIYV